MSAFRRLQVLYLTSTDGPGEALGAATRIVIGVLARDVDVSLAVAGSVGHQALQQLREDFVSMRAAGGFPASSADLPAPPGLASLSQERLGSSIVNARLQAAIQRRSASFDAVVVDDLTAWPYRPAQCAAPVYYLAHRCEARRQSTRWWQWLTASRRHRLQQYEKAVFGEATSVFAKPPVAAALLSLGLPLRQLNPSFGRFRPDAGLSPAPQWVQTLPRVGYAGYLGDQDNLASLEWLLREVWTPGRHALRDIELHLVGAAPPSPLRELVAANNNVYLHSGGRQHLQHLGCRAVIEPLQYEQHVDTKLVNAMALGLPVVTTHAGLARAHSRLGDGVVATSGAEQMAMTVHQLMHDEPAWQLHADAARRTAMQQLDDFEVAHDVRRALLRLDRQEGGGELMSQLTASQNV